MVRHHSLCLGAKKTGGRSRPEFDLQEIYFFGVLGCSGLVGFGWFEGDVPVVELGFMSGVLPVVEPLLETETLSTILRLPANDCAIRFASSRSFCDGAVPLSVTLSALTSTEILLLVSVGSLWNAVLMSFLI